MWSYIKYSHYLYIVFACLWMLHLVASAVAHVLALGRFFQRALLQKSSIRSAALGGPVLPQVCPDILFAIFLIACMAK